LKLSSKSKTEFVGGQTSFFGFEKNSWLPSFSVSVKTGLQCVHCADSD